MDDFSVLDELRKRGVKRAVMADDRFVEVEFFPPAPPPIPSPDLDTIIPPAPGDEDTQTEFKVPPAMARILKRGSVS